jgi:hypothetical protein
MVERASKVDNCTYDLELEKKWNTKMTTFDRVIIMINW